MNSKIKDNFRINLIDLLPEEYLTVPVSIDFIKIYFKRKGSGPNPKSFIFPKVLTIDEEFVEAISMYIGDGKLSADKHHLDFTSKDADMIKFMLEFFKNRFNLKIDDIRYTLTYRELKRFSVKNWSNFLSIDIEKINLKQSNRHKEECFGMQIGGLIFREIFGNIVSMILNLNYYIMKTHRQAFLRGLYAAEGGLGIVKSENYIAYMAYHLSYYKEKYLAELVMRLLEWEGISSKQILRKNKGERYIQITNWKNYYKCWNIRLFGRCGRKRIKFLKKLEKTNIFLSLKKEFIQLLLNKSGLSHRQISKNIEVNPATLCAINRDQTSYVNIRSALRLCNLNNISITILEKNIISLRINRQTILKDTEFIHFMLQYLPEKIKNPKTWLP